MKSEHDNPGAVAAGDLERLQREQYAENELSGTGAGGEYERGYRKGWNDHVRSEIRRRVTP